ncbi:MAG: aminopeptidase [Saccharofermentanales bacterium]|jgi:leucyl aminopeptidase (aminopeptidase T)|nr:aminopeptidase [Bacillota bacterium]
MYEMELVNACLKLLRDCFNVQPGEVVAITVDTEVTMEVTDATAQAAVILGAKPVVIKTPAARGSGKAGDPDLPIEALVGILNEVDVWVEYNGQWIFYSTVFDRVISENKDLRYMCLVEATPGMMIRNIGKVDIPLLGRFIRKVASLTEKTKHMRITTPAGMDIEFENMPGRELGVADGIVNKGEVRMLPGQIGWAPNFETINGVIVVDGIMSPAVNGPLDQPIKMYVEKGKVVKIEGGASAKQLESWLKSFNDPNMYNVAHASYGLGPFAELSGNICEDERIWGCSEWGFGNIGAVLTIPDIPEGIPAASHTDGVCLNSTVYLDGELLFKDGEIVGPDAETVEMARKLGK